MTERIIETTSKNYTLEIRQRVTDSYYKARIWGFIKEGFRLSLSFMNEETFAEDTKDHTDQECEEELIDLFNSIKNSIVFGCSPIIGDGIGMEIEYQVVDRYFYLDKDETAVHYVLDSPRP